MLSRVKQLVDENEKLKDQIKIQSNRKPHECPYCSQARKEIGIGFHVKCNPCNETGIVWEP